MWENRTVLCGSNARGRGGESVVVRGSEGNRRLTHDNMGGPPGTPIAEKIG